MLKILQTDKPQIVQTWMYHADLLGGICAKLAGRQPIIWNIRHSDLNASVDKKTTIMTAKMCARLSRFLPNYIVCCSETAKSIHEKLGYDPSKIIVIPNGFDINDFRPDNDARHRLRAEIGIGDNKILIGLVGRYHPQKDHNNFIQAAAELSTKVTGVEYLLCGSDIDWQNDELVQSIEKAGMREVFHLLGVRHDITSVTASLDIATSASSCGEGFPNTIGEAMACGVPCVVTDVGDSAMIVGSAGTVVTPNHPSELSSAWLELILAGMEHMHKIGMMARKRVVDNFTIDNVVDKYQDLYLRTLK
jgi:glycosyltransferase involved in cell wall biosynthesis